MKYLFGPVNSRRLGRSLGIDLIPGKICSFDCVYCEVGAKRLCTAERREYSPTAAIIAEIQQFLGQPEAGDSIDIFTITASGEPTLHTGLGTIINHVKQHSAKPVAVLTNASLFHLEAVRRELGRADIVIPSLDAARPDSYRRVNRPHRTLPIETIIQGLATFRRQYTGRIWLEILLVQGLNDHNDDLAALAVALDRIQPDAIQLNTVVRPPMEKTARPLDQATLERIARRLGPKTRIIADFKTKTNNQQQIDADTLLAMLRRRPCTHRDICEASQAPAATVSSLLDTLRRQGKITTSRHGGNEYYLNP